MRRSACARSLTRSSCDTPDSKGSLCSELNKVFEDSFRPPRKGCLFSRFNKFLPLRSELVETIHISLNRACRPYPLQVPAILVPPLRASSQNACKLGVSCHVNRAIPHPLVDRTSFGP